MIWMPDEPVPTTATRLPARSTEWSGQLLVQYSSPSKVSIPSNSGFFGRDRPPTAEITNRAVEVDPSSVPTVQRAVASSHLSDVTRLFNWNERARSSLPATHSR